MDLEVKLRAFIEAVRQGKKVTFFQGAGVSTSAGIPDFRSPKTGLYANLAKFNLPYPEAVFDIDYFKENPNAFYMLAHELYPGKFNPTKYHFMLKLFQNRNQIQRIYTQNIDTLERIVGIEPELIVEAHGSFASNHCIKCHHEMSVELIKEHMAKKHDGDGIPRCSKCQGLVKPDITFFGEGLPSRFFDMWDQDCENVEVAIIAGTSLAVYPFASLPEEIDPSTMRVLINQELVGDFTRDSDITVLGDCDKIAEKIVKLLGWEREFELIIDIYHEKIRNKTIQDLRGFANLNLDEDKNEPRSNLNEALETSKDVAKKVGEVVEESKKVETKDMINQETNPKTIQEAKQEVEEKKPETEDIKHETKVETNDIKQETKAETEDSTLKTTVETNASNDLGSQSISSTGFNEDSQKKSLDLSSNVDDDISRLDKQISGLDITDTNKH